MDGTQEDTLRTAGNECYKKGDFEGALKLYNASLEKQKTAASILNRAQAYIQLKRFEEALVDCDSVLETEKGNFKAHGRKAISLHALGRLESALEELLWCLEVQPDDERFQKLYDECQMKLDSKQFVNMKMMISSYPGNDSDEMTLRLVKGLPFLTSIKSETLRFKSLDTLEAYLGEHISASFGSIRLQDSTVDDRLMEFFRSLNPAILCSGCLEYFNVKCSKAYFDELFGGTLFRPMGIWFYQQDGAPYEKHFYSAINARKLPAIVNVKGLKVSLLDSELSKAKVPVPTNGQQQTLIDIDSFLDILHTEDKGIPAHIRRSTEFMYHPPEISGERNMEVDEAIAMMRAMAGRMAQVDLRYFGLGKLQELLSKCKRRFLSSSSPISYSLSVRFFMKGDPGDAVALFPIIQRDEPLVLRNAIGEKLQFSLRYDHCSVHNESETSDDDDEQKSAERAICLSIERVIAPHQSGQ